MVDFSEALTYKAYQINPVLPQPVTRETSQTSGFLELFDASSSYEESVNREMKPDDFSLTEEHIESDTVTGN